MKVKEAGEFSLIERLAKGCVVRPANVIKGIGDDAAAFRPPEGEVLLVTTDLLIEGVHFLKGKTAGEELGHKALAVNLSDMAAMGGTPAEAFVSIAIPDDCDIAYIEEIYRGMKRLASTFSLNILGGDTTRSLRDLVINIALMGSAPEEEILYRHGARAGDLIYLAGYPGESRAGLHLLLADIAPETEGLRQLSASHRLPHPQIPEGRFLAAAGAVHAAMDVSDGLSSDLAHIAKQSGVGIRLFADKIPISENLKQFCDRFGFDPLEYALAGGEDYLLAFTVPEEKADALADAFRAKFETPLFSIGEVTASGPMELSLPGGGIRTITPSGWDHFIKR